MTEQPTMPSALRPFRLRRDSDVSGVSGTGYVAEGVAFSDGTVALRWLTAWPTSVVFHDRGVQAVEQVHGHGGATRIEWGQPSGSDYPLVWAELRGYIAAAAEDGEELDSNTLLSYMDELRQRALAPIKAWMDGVTSRD